MDAFVERVWVRWAGVVWVGAMLALTGCSSHGSAGPSSGGGGGTGTPAATPVFSVAAGTYTAVQTVAITDATAGALIYYTTDGSAPSTQSTPYSGPITVKSSETVQAFAVATGYSGSPIVSAAYVINPSGRAFADGKALVGAHVYVLAAGTSGYGGAGLAAASANASVSLLSAASAGLSDSVGAYVTTQADGSFLIGGEYSCTPGQQVYLYALGGSTGSGTNTGIGLLAALGTCPAAGSFVTAAPYVVMNEVSTIATAYAFAGFATDATHVGSSGSSLAKVGIANAFANATNLETLSTGAALATTPAGNGTVPQAEINTLANILASCTATGAAGSNGCTLLFGDALSGGTSGAMPTDTATAAINIAHNPGANVAGLFGLAQATPPFAGGLTAQPNDFIVGLRFTGGGLNQPKGVTIDSSGDAWVANAGGGSYPGGGGVSEFASSGAALSTSTGYVGAGFYTPSAIGIDAAGRVWVLNSASTGGGVSEISNSGSVLLNLNAAATPSNNLGCIIGEVGGMALDAPGNVWVTTSPLGSQTPCVAEVSTSGSLLSGSGYTGGGLAYPDSIAIDGSGNAWAAGSDAIVKFSSAGSVLSGSGGYQDGSMYGFGSITLDASGDAWAVAMGTSLVKISNAGVFLSGASGFTGGGLHYPFDIAIDGAGNAWVLNGGNVVSSVDLGGSVSEFTNAGQPVTGATGYVGPSAGGNFLGSLAYAEGLAVDGSGNVWTTNQDSPAPAFLTEFIGAATPVITPIAAGLPATPTADGSSKLGTRP